MLHNESQIKCISTSLLLTLQPWSRVPLSLLLLPQPSSPLFRQRVMSLIWTPSPSTNMSKRRTWLWWSSLLLGVVTAKLLVCIFCSLQPGSWYQSLARGSSSVVDQAPLTLLFLFLAPEWEKAATELSGTVKLAKVDCTVEQDICTGQDVKGYPTIKVFRNGVPSEYGGPRQADGIVSYMKK